METLRYIDQTELYQYIPEEVKEQLEARRVLFQAISESEILEETVLTLLEDPGYQKEVNYVFKTSTGAETLLMWAVWNLKSKVVKRLLELGADPYFTDDYGSNVSNFWDVEKIKKNQLAAAEIAEMLHRHGVDLAQDGVHYSHSLIRKIGPFDFTILEDRLMALGYKPSLEEIEDRIKDCQGDLKCVEEKYHNFQEENMPEGMLIDLRDQIMEYHVKIHILEEKKKFCA